MWKIFIFLFIIFNTCVKKSYVVSLPPTIFKTEKSKNGVSVEIIDDEILFNEGIELYKKGKYNLAYKKYKLILQNFKESPYIIPSLYNAGLCLLKSNNYETSINYFEKYINDVQTEKDKIDGNLKLIEALLGAKKYDESIELSNKLLINETLLDPFEKIEVWTRLGYSLKMKRNFIEAEKNFKKAIKEYENFNEKNPLISNEFVAMANYEIGEIYRELFSEIKFQLPVETMEKNLIDKATFFLKSQKNYLDTIRVHNPYWSAAAGYKIGKLYEDFYFDLLNAEVPQELKKEEVKIYFEELKKKISPLIHRAIEIYEKNLLYGETSGYTADWIKKTEERLQFLKNYCCVP